MKLPCSLSGIFFRPEVYARYIQLQRGHAGHTEDLQDLQVWLTLLPPQRPQNLVLIAQSECTQPSWAVNFVSSCASMQLHMQFLVSAQWYNMFTCLRINSQLQPHQYHHRTLHDNTRHKLLAVPEITA